MSIDFFLLILKQNSKYKRCSKLKITLHLLIPGNFVKKIEKSSKHGFILRYQDFSGTIGDNNLKFRIKVTFKT